jgi:2-amino-4-hydroxy-6-hydroxymethyldihydropteridine diphosphokinase
VNAERGTQNAEQVALVALGSNLGDSAATVRRAFEELQKLSARPIQRSSLWQTTPVDCPPGSPAFINAAVALTPIPGETPESLVEKLFMMEWDFGRRPKTVMNEPRPIDIDLIAFGAEVRSQPTLMLPHPRAHLRRFVLQPLTEVAPDFVLPGQSRSIAELLADLRTPEKLTKLAR